MDAVKRYGKTYKKFSKRTSRRYARAPMYRALSGVDTTSVKVEYYLSVFTDPSGGIFFNGGNTFLNIATILAGSTSFTSMVADYARYKFNGLQMRFDTSMPVPNSDLLALPQPVFAFYPQSTSNNAGTAPRFNDNKFAASPAITTPQTKYLPFPNNYFQSAEGGYGTWNNSNDYTSISGQISVTVAAAIAPTTNSHVLGVLRITFYMSASTKNQ